MGKFIVKILIILAITIVVILVKIITSNVNYLKKNNFRNLPLNNVSNSPCFKAKIDHLVSSQNFKNCTFLIAGSSMSLNNVSGRIICNRTNEDVYNISSWEFKPKQLNQFLKIINIDSIKYLLVAFNNWDFGELGFKIDYKATDSYINGNNLKRYWCIINKFNYNTFSQDLANRNKFSEINNAYESLNFDKYGSILFDHVGFVISKKRWDAYKDTLGFHLFYNDINDLDFICNKHKITLILVYLPNRPNLLTLKNIIQNKNVSDALRRRFAKSFIDLQNTNIPQNQFCDGTHLFKDGAERVTNLIIDSLSGKKQLCPIN